MADAQNFGNQGRPADAAEEVDIDELGRVPVVVDEDTPRDPFPEAVFEMTDEEEQALKSWVDEWLMSLKSSHEAKERQWAQEEVNYRAVSLGPLNTPFVGACGDIVPVIAMAVDPIHARLDTGIFKNKPVIKLTGLKKSILKYVNALEQWFEYYQKNRLRLRTIASPRILEMTKHGTMIFKTIYDYEAYTAKGYDKKWNVVDKDVVTFAGPRVFGISIQDLLWAPGYSHINDCPFVAERIRTTAGQLAIAEESGKLKNVEKVKEQTTNQKDVVRDERERSANHEGNAQVSSDVIEVWEIWCDYVMDKERGTPVRLVLTYHADSSTFLQRRYNWYFHQRKPYTVIPYQITNDSLFGLGICEMSEFFQIAQTKWHRMAEDNTYLANIRMFIAKKDCGIEEVPKLYTGRTFFVDNPQTDFIPFAAADVYPSTLQERQNLFGLTEKRTGVSDYLTGRESPIVGSRATATSTVALIQEGKGRVEEVFENVRAGMSDIFGFCMSIWIQYGLDGLEDVVFGDDETATLIKDFFDSLDKDNVSGMVAIDLAATDAANNKAVQQQVQLAIIQVMMQYLNKLVEAGQLALSAAATQPTLTKLIGEVMESARKMFLDLLTKYDVRNPEDYLPDLQQFLDDAIAEGTGGAGGFAPGDPRAQMPPSMAGGAGAPAGLPGGLPTGAGLPGNGGA